MKSSELPESSYQNDRNLTEADLAMSQPKIISMPWLLWKMISVLPCALPNLHGEEKIHSVWKSTEAVIYTLENGLRGSDHLKVCLGNELALTGDWVDMNLKGFDGVYNTKSQMDCFAEKMLGIKNTIPADIEDGYYVQGIIEAMMNSTQSRTWHKVSDYIIK